MTEPEDFNLGEELNTFAGYLRASQSPKHVQPKDSSDTTSLARTLKVLDEQQVLRTVWRPLGTASEAGGLLHHFFDGEGGFQQTGCAAIARVVLLGAARTSYMLSAQDPPTRELRVLETMNGECEDHTRALKAARLLDPGSKNLPAESVILARQAAIGQELQKRGYNPARAVSETDVLRAAADDVISSGSGSTFPFRELIAVLWSETSGAAHARGWTWDGPRQMPPQDREVMLLVPSRILLSRAWFLWRQRGGITA